MTPLEKNTLNQQKPLILSQQKIPFFLTFQGLNGKYVFPTLLRDSITSGFDDVIEDNK